MAIANEVGARKLTECFDHFLLLIFFRFVSDFEIRISNLKCFALTTADAIAQMAGKTSCLEPFALFKAARKPKIPK
jgi:hypothetical protein